MDVMSAFDRVMFDLRRERAFTVCATPCSANRWYLQSINRCS